MTPRYQPVHSWIRALSRRTATGVTLMLVGLAAAHANDALRATVTDADGGIVTENGAFLTPGTYAIGTLKIQYFVAGWQFQAGMQKNIELCFDTSATSAKGASNQATAYPATVRLEQVGGSSLVLAASENPLVFTYTGDGHCVNLTATVPAAVANDPEYQDDGEELVANLQLRTPPGTNLDTVTTIKVHMTLAHPTACLRALHTVMNQDFTADLAIDGISLTFQQNQEKLSSLPQYPHHVLALVNTCEQAASVDVAMSNDPNFELFHTNAVRTTTLNQELADEAALPTAGLDWDSLGIVAPALCLQNVSVAAGETVLIAQRISILETGKFPGGSGTRDLGGSSYDGFGFAAYEAGGACTLAPSDDVLPNQDDVSVPVAGEVKLTGSTSNQSQGGKTK